MIKVENLDKSFNGTIVLEDISVTFQKGKRTSSLAGAVPVKRFS